MSVGLLCSVIGQTVGFRIGNWPGSVWEESMEGKERHWNEINRTKRSKAFSGHQRVSECFVKAGLRALISQLWSIHRTLCWPSDTQVKDVWIREEQANNKCNWSEIQVTLKHPRWNARARRVSRECPLRAGCQPKSHFYRGYCGLNISSGFGLIWYFQLHSVITLMCMLIFGTSKERTPTFSLLCMKSWKE